MSCSPLSPTCCVALGGCCAGGGCGIPSNFSSACQNFSSSGISGACQTAMGACGPAVQSALSSIPGCCSGIASGPLANSLASAGINPSNVVGGCLGQAQSLFQNSTAGIISTMQATNAFCQNSFDVRGIIEQCKNLNLSGGDLGFNLTSIKNVVTGGLTAEFGSLASQGFKELCTNLANCGTLIDPKNLQEAFTPQGLINRVVEQGFGKEMLAELEKVGLNSVTDIIDANEKLLMQALESVPKEVVGAIVEKTGVKTIGESLNSLAEIITQPVKIFGEKANELIGGSVDELQKKLSNVLGAETLASTMGTVGQALSKIVEPVTTIMDQANNDLAAWEGQFPTQQQLAERTGSGSGIFGNPTIADVIGVAAGIGFTSKILDMTNRQTRILETSEGTALKQAIDSAIANPANDSENAAAIQAAAQAFINPTNPVIRDEITAAQQSFDEISNKIIKEKNNLRAANIVPADNQGNVSDILAWISELHNVHDDPSNLGLADYIVAISDDSVTGEAIRAAIEEGRNLAIFRSLGVTPPITVNALSYAEQLLNRAGIANIISALTKEELVSLFGTSDPVELERIFAGSTPAAILAALGRTDIGLNCCPASRVSPYGIG